MDAMFEKLYVGKDEALDAALEANARAELPAVDVAPNQGKLLHVLARMCGARKVLEIGTLGGYSTIWLARAVGEGGRVITLESDAKHAEVARSNLARAGLTSIVDVRVGAALDTLPSLEGPFDLVFVDADKKSNPEYLEWSLRLARAGTVIIVDNVVRRGAILDAAKDDPNIVGTRRFHEMFAQEPRIVATAVQTVGVKGWDGFAIGIVV
jgi:predicted O-methyltransferase YrrM